MAVTTAGFYGQIIAQNDRPVTTAGFYGKVLTKNYQVTQA